VRTTEHVRELEENEVAVLMLPIGGELLNYSDKRVRFLALTSTVKHSSRSASRSDPSPIS
jgi:hypothetical protein